MNSQEHKEDMQVCLFALKDELATYQLKYKLERSKSSSHKKERDEARRERDAVQRENVRFARKNMECRLQCTAASLFGTASVCYVHAVSILEALYFDGPCFRWELSRVVGHATDRSASFNSTLARLREERLVEHENNNIQKPYELTSLFRERLGS